ncbi:hypothetical protein COCOR_02722 [Corallococcus coralloides DSM 2259]|uniref:Lipoprotein n=1 Tax=Corallococcus coralloides (strain ATCC 25202 / DSM 2259 / NBRC 100086 / M2) TaxID=1144275 RepID=H8MVF7_CORCM|nr:hypothetical protein [Corallococcus coralloides]AFE04780.1 hypothetical protein COCOR_02722 [Corallococcus coralloides DSM 2259]
MTRNDWRRRTLGVLLVGGAAVWGAGCQKEQPQASALPDAGVVAVAQAGGQDAKPVAKPLKFSGVRLKRDRYYLDVTYTLTNPGTAQGRGEACLSLLDEKGFVVRTLRLGHVTVKGGTDDVFMDRVFLPEEFWPQTRTVLLYTAREYHCENDAFSEASEPLRLLPTGSPAPADAPAPGRPEKPKPGELTLSDVELTQQGRSDEYRLRYTVKNVSARRINGQACLQGYGAVPEPDEDRATLVASTLDTFSVPAGATVTFTDPVNFPDPRRWDEVATLDLFLDARGCASKPEAAPARLRFDKPENVRAPGEGGPELDESDAFEPDEDTETALDEGDARDPDEEETGMDESDAYDPEVEFPQEPSSPADEETAD